VKAGELKIGRPNTQQPGIFPKFWWRHGIPNLDTCIF